MRAGKFVSNIARVRDPGWRADGGVAGESEKGPQLDMLPAPAQEGKTTYPTRVEEDLSGDIQPCWKKSPAVRGEELQKQ